ncbi:hypothetical protein STEG23_031404, partial [Scotinomys teguina]
MTVTPLGRDQDCSLKNREPDVPGSLGSWILEVGARPSWLDCTSSSLESVPCPFHPVCPPPSPQTTDHIPWTPDPSSS